MLVKESKKMKKYSPIYILLVFFFTLSACTPAEPPVPIETVFAATHAALMAQTAAAKSRETNTPTAINTLRPTITPIPSATGFVLTLTFTPTVTPVPSPTNVTSGSGNVLYACEIISLSPKSDYYVKPNEKFKWTWQVRNIGTTKWLPDTMLVGYESGSKYYIKKNYPLERTTRVGETGLFNIKMQAPKEPGTYTTTWALQRGIHTFCYGQLRIIVQE